MVTALVIFFSILFLGLAIITLRMLSYDDLYLGEYIVLSKEERQVLDQLLKESDNIRVKEIYLSPFETSLNRDRNSNIKLETDNFEITMYTMGIISITDKRTELEVVGKLRWHCFTRRGLDKILYQVYDEAAQDLISSEDYKEVKKQLMEYAYEKIQNYTKC